MAGWSSSPAAAAGSAVAPRTSCRRWAPMWRVGRKEDKLIEVWREIAEDGGKASVHATDIRDEAGVIRVVDTVLADHGRIDGLVNNAGGQYRSELKDVSTKGFEAVVRTNLVGGFIFMREVY